MIFTDSEHSSDFAAYGEVTIELEQDIAKVKYTDYSESTAAFVAGLLPNEQLIAYPNKDDFESEEELEDERETFRVMLDDYLYERLFSVEPFPISLEEKANNTESFELTLN